MKRLLSGYLIIESIGIVIWWTILILVPTSRDAFRFPECTDAALFAFILPDGLILVGSALTILVLWKRDPILAGPLLWLHFGANLYATCYCIMQFILSSGASFWPMVIMLPNSMACGLLLVTNRSNL